MKSKVLASFQPWFQPGEIALCNTRGVEGCKPFHIAYGFDSEDETCRKVTGFDSLIKAVSIYRKLRNR